MNTLLLFVQNLFSGTRGFPGAVRLALLRVLGLLLCSFPAKYLGEGAFQEALSGHVSEGGPLSFESFSWMTNEGAGAYAGGLVAGLIAFLLWDQLLTATALHLADGAGDRVRTWTLIWNEGWRKLLVLLRVAACALLAQVLVVVVIAQILSALQEKAMREGWTGDDRFIVMPAMAIMVGAGLFALIGAVAFMARTLIVVDDREQALRSVLDALRMALRRPGWALAFAGLTLTVQLLAGALLANAWPSALGVWVLVLVLQAWLWIGLCKALRRVYLDGPFGKVQATADAPLPVIGWLAQKVAARLPAGWS